MERKKTYNEYLFKTSVNELSLLGNEEVTNYKPRPLTCYRFSRGQTLMHSIDASSAGGLLIVHPLILVSVSANILYGPAVPYVHDL